VIEIKDDRINFEDGMFRSTCSCGKKLKSKYKVSILKSINNGYCISCFVPVKMTQTKDVFLHNNKWSCYCLSCGNIRSYTRKEHARNSFILKSTCKKCSAFKKSNSASIGWVKREYNKYIKSAKARCIYWNISEEYIESIFNGKCSLTGWDISPIYKIKTASLDRINSKLGYIEGNVQWVHSMVNMSKNKYDQNEFIAMCSSVHLNIANKVK
jgi:RNase P subunit RPR2